MPITKAPWQRGFNKRGNTFQIFGYEGRQVCNLTIYGQGHKDTEVVENANLIAAAPKMLEALEEIASTKGVPKNVKVIAKNAIQEARGLKHGKH